MSQSSLTRLIGKQGTPNKMQGFSGSISSPSHVIFSPQKCSVGPEPTALQLRRSISNSVERNVIEEINLHQACRDGMFDAVETLLSDGSRDINEIDTCGFSPLHYAARYDHADVTALLLEYGADPNQVNRYDTRKFTPLQLACWFNSLDVVRVLLNQGSRSYKEEHHGQRAIHFAAARGSPKIVKELLVSGNADPNAVDGIGFTPLHIAANRGRDEIVKVLAQHGADVTIQDNDGNMPTHVAACEGHAVTLKTLLQSAIAKGVSLECVLESTVTGSCLQLATKRSNVEAAKVCLEYGASTTANLHDTTPPLHRACIIGNMELVKCLVTSGASLEADDIEGMTPILRACLNGNVEIIDYLITKGASLEAEVNAPSPLMCAVKRGHSDAIRLLLRRGSSVSVRDPYHRTCLHVAVWSDHEGTLDILLEYSGSFLVNSRDNDENTPLHYATINGNLKMILKLLNAGADTSLSDNEDKLPIHHAAEVGDLTCFKALFEVNPKSIHATDYTLRTPLYYAALENHTEILQFLIENGAHVNIRDDDRLTPLLAVSRESSVQVVELLLKNGANVESLSKNRATALLVASFFGNTPVVKTLLDRGAELDTRSPFGHGCLDAAMRGSQKDTCMEIIKHERWREALKVKNHEGFTCMKGLIKKYPDVAKAVLDKCIASSSHPSTDKNYSFSNQPKEWVHVDLAKHLWIVWKKTQNWRCLLCRGPNFQAKRLLIDRYDFEYLSIHPDERQYTGCDTYFGPLTMLQNGRRELLLHPVSRELLKTKWNGIARYQTIFSLGMYIAFVINMTMFILCFGQINPETGEKISNDYSFCKKHVMNLQSIAVSGFSGAWILAHIYRILREKWNYMNRDSLFEMIMLFSCVLSSWIGSFVLDRTTQYGWCIFSIILCYMVLLFFVQTLFESGIYVTMLFVVLKSLLKVITIFLILLLAFALIFHLLLYSGKDGHRIQGPCNSTIVIPHPFRDVFKSSVKVMAMMIGELEYARFFVEQKNDIPELANLIFVIFCALLPIVLMNLLIGLAVGDIESVQQNAKLKVLSLKIEVIYALEQQLPAVILRYFYKPFVVKYPNKPLGLWSKWIKALGHRLTGSSSDDLPEVSNRTDKKSVEKLVTRMCEKIDEQDKRMDELVSDVEQQMTLLDRIAEILLKDSDNYLEQT